jgi:preprotein translocase subunit SecD
MGRLGFSLVLTVIFLPSNGLGQAGASRPLTIRQIEELVSIGAPDLTVHAEIQSRGLAFIPDQARLALLREKGAGSETLTDIQALIGRGWSLVLEVQVQDAIRQTADRTIDDLKTQMRNWHLNWDALDRSDPQTVAEAANTQIRFHGIPAADGRQFEQKIAAAFGDWMLVMAGAGSYQLSLRPEVLHRLESAAVDGVVETLRQRVEALGLVEVAIRQDASGSDCCKVACRFPPVVRPDRVKEMLFTVGALRLRKVKDGPFPSTDEALRAYGGVLPLATRLAHQSNGPGQGWYLLEFGSVASTSDLRDAEPAPAGSGKWLVTCRLKGEGAKNFAQSGQAVFGSRIAIMIDGKMWGVHEVREPQTPERFEIHGFEQEEAAGDFALLLRSGELPAGIHALRESAGYE